MTRPEAARPHTNRLATQTSPYLLQHAHNPVDWYPWGPEALAAAKESDKPIFLSIGYAACHWCHVMERESFEDEATADDMRRDFIAIKVDREERPDLDQVYMAAVQAMTGGGGWPMSVFITPDGRPFYGGTYFPSEPRHGLPSFRQVLAGVARAWREDRAAIEATGSRLVAALVEQARTLGATADRPELADEGRVEAAVAALEATFDARRGGWGGAPKFPAPMAVEFLLRRAAGRDGRVASGVAADDRQLVAALAMARRTLDAMAAGGIHDQLGGGFHRYATDAIWLVPHFEQMLYDNAQLARVYIHAWQLTGERRYRDVAEGVLDFMTHRLQTADGGFAASLDADTDGVEGATFTWTQEEIRDVLEPAEAELFLAANGVTEAGNWEGRSILSRVESDEDLAGRFGLAPAEVARLLVAARVALLERRDERAQPARDDKVLAAWNGLAIAAFADAVAAGLDERHRATAERAATAVLRGLRLPDGRLRRSWKDGRASAEGVLEDYAHLAEGLLALYEATFDERWFTAARGLADVIVARFADPAGGFFDTADDAETLATRPKDLQDNAIPSGGAMAATVLLRLAALTGESHYRDAAEAAIGQVLDLAPRHPTFFGQWLIALDLALAAIAEVAVVGAPDEAATQALVAVVRQGYRPYQVLAVGRQAEASAVPLLHGRALSDGRPTAYVCRNFACRRPVNEPSDLEALLTALLAQGPGPGS
jgi:uncharacterized protein YyaL (SSP411 family)